MLISHIWVMKQLELLIGKMMSSRTLLHVAFCLAFVAVFSVSVLVSGNHDVVITALVSCMYILACTYMGRWYGKSWLSREAKPLSVPSLFLSFLALFLSGAVGAALMFKGNVAPYFLQYLAICFPLSVLFVFLGVVLALARHAFWMQVREAKMAQQQKESELRILLSQLSPHFLFNTLNNIYGISLARDKRVPNLLLKLSDLLRYAIYETKQDFIPLNNEIEYLSNYIEFEKIQTGSRLALEFSFTENLNDQILIAPMLLIVFVENAFKYSKETRDPKMSVAISLYVLNDWIYFTIRNSYSNDLHAITSPEEHSGIGLHHTLKRLNLIYEKDFQYHSYKDETYYNVELRLIVKK